MSSRWDSSELARRLRELAAQRARTLAEVAGERLLRFARGSEPGSPAVPTPDAPDGPVSDVDRDDPIRAAMDMAVAVGNVGLWDADILGGTFRGNTQLHAIYGRPDYAQSSAPAGVALSSSEWRAALAPGDLARVDAAFARGAALDEPITYEHSVVLPHGEVRRVRSVAVVLRDDQGRHHRAIGTTLDITDSEVLGHALEVERERLVLATRIAGIGVWDYDFASQRYYWDARMHELYGLAPGTFSGEGGAWVALLEPEHRARVSESWNRAVATRTVFDAEYPLRRPGCAVRYLRVLARVLADAEGRPVRAVGCTWDVTRERELGETLRRAKDAADEANRAKSAFLANMSHEIRTPMNGVLGMAELVLGSELTAQQRDYVSTIHASAEALLVVIDDILDYSKIEAGKIDITPLNVALRPALAETLTPLALRAEHKGIELVTVVEPSCPTMLRADWNRIRQVITNLVGNAVKFTAVGSVSVRVDVEVEPTGRSTRLLCTVSDTGPGIEPAMLERIFAPFDQAHPGIHAAYGGSGLGLAIAAQLVGLMGGDMVARSTPAEGSTFGFELPVEIVDAPASVHIPRARVQTPVADSDGTEVLRVLVAEDHHVNQRVIGAMLERCGHVVRVVANGRDAVEAATEEHFDVILMDIEMPEFDGLEATARIREAERASHRHVPIVALTAHAMAGDRERFLAAGLDGYLTKPIGAAALVAALDEATRAGGSRGKRPAE